VFTAPFARADIEQLDRSQYYVTGLTDCTPTSYSPNPNAYQIAQSFRTGTAFTVTSIAVKLGANLPTSDAETLYVYSSLDNHPQTLIATSSNSITPSEAAASVTTPSVFTFSPTLSLSANVNYWFVETRATPQTCGSGSFHSFDYQDGNPYPNGNIAYKATSGSTTWTQATDLDLYFSISSTEITHDAPAITYPADGYEFTDTGIVSVSGTCDDSDGFDTVTIIASDASGDDITSIHAECKNDTFDTLEGKYANEVFALWNGEFDLRAISYASGPVEEGVPYFSDTSAQVHIIISGSGIEAPPVISGTDETDCSAATDLVERMTCFLALKIKGILSFLFVPSQTNLNQLANLKNQIAAKPPFGYYALLSDALSGVEEGDEGADLTGSSELASVFFTPVSTVFSVGLWFLFGVYVLKRIRHLEI